MPRISVMAPAPWCSSSRLVGFGAKAGVVPVHVWLPRAHPEAPSHVSAVMSGAMVKLGVYGVVRVGWDLLGGGPAWWGVTVLVLGLVSAMFGVLHALVASDLKRLLAYSTTENVGLMFVGVGAAGVFAASGNRPLAAVALAAGLLHVMNHAAFKGLLFLGAGSVLSATGHRDLDRLGGLGAPDAGHGGHVRDRGDRDLGVAAAERVRERMVAAAVAGAQPAVGHRGRVGGDAGRGDARRTVRWSRGGGVREGVRDRVPRHATFGRRRAAARGQPPDARRSGAVGGRMCRRSRLPR